MKKNLNLYAISNTKSLIKKIVALMLTVSFSFPYYSAIATPATSSTSNNTTTSSAPDSTTTSTSNESSNSSTESKSEEESWKAIKEELNSEEFKRFLKASPSEREQMDENITAEARFLLKSLIKNGKKIPYSYTTVIPDDNLSGMVKNSVKAFVSGFGLVFVSIKMCELLLNYRSAYGIISNFIKENFSKNDKKLEIENYKNVLKNIETRLRNELVGQDEAIDKLIDLLTGYFESIIQAKELGKKFEGGLVLYLSGEPGTGKSTTMKIIAEETGMPTNINLISSVVNSRSTNARNCAERLLKPEILDDGKSKIEINTPLTLQLKNAVPALYCFDEIDKMRNLDSVLQNSSPRNKDGKITAGSIDDIIRNFGDTGTIDGKDVSGSILIATSNETPEQLSELESSLYNRYKTCNIEFKSFNKKDYSDIMKRKIQDVAQYYKNKFQVDVQWDASTIEYFTEKYEKENSGVRIVDRLIDNVRCVLRKYQDTNENLEGLKLLIKYNQKNQKLYVEIA